MLMPHVMKPRRSVWPVAFRLQIYLVLMCLPIVFVAAASTTTLCALAALKGISLAVLDSTAVIVRWCVATIRSMLRLAPAESLGTRVAGTDQ
jgi:hypothetical protein